MHTIPPLLPEQALIWALLLLFGCGYAFLITFWPFTPKYTWLEVAIGVAATNLGVVFGLWYQPQTLNIMLINIHVWIPYGLTGIPMILLQGYKYFTSDRTAKTQAQKDKEKIDKQSAANRNKNRGNF